MQRTVLKIYTIDGDESVYALKSDGYSVTLGGEITDDNIAVDAGIAGTKIEPDFGSLNLKTTGVLILGDSASTSGFIRFPYNGGFEVPLVTAKNSGGTNATGISYGMGNLWTLGNSAQNTTVNGSLTIVNGASAVNLRIADANILTLESDHIQFVKQQKTLIGSFGTRWEIPGAISTVGSSSQNLFSWTLASSATTFIKVEIAALKTNGIITGDSWTGITTYAHDGSSFSTIDAADITHHGSTLFNVIFDRSGSTFTVSVVGLGGDNINWAGTMTIIETRAS